MVEHERLEASSSCFSRLGMDRPGVRVPDVVVTALRVQQRLPRQGVVLKRGRVAGHEVVPLHPPLAPEHIVVNRVVEAGEVDGYSGHATRCKV